jgi:hypothetical protein
MDNEEIENPMDELLAHSLEGNALAVQDAVNAVLSQKALDALAAMKVDVAQSIYGTYGSEQQDADIDPMEPEADDETEWEVPEDDVGLDDELEGIFDEIEDLTNDETEQEDSGEDSSDE